MAGGPTTLALADIPSAYLAWYQGAAQTCPGLPWGVLTGIGKVERRRPLQRARCPFRREPRRS